MQDEGGLDAVEEDMFLKLNTVVLLRFLDSCCDYVSSVRGRARHAAGSWASCATQHLVLQPDPSGCPFSTSKS